MASCMHARCASSITCQLAPGELTFHEVARCDHCRQSVVFVPQDLLWVIASGHPRPGDRGSKIECPNSPTNRHEVKQ